MPKKKDWIDEWNEYERKKRKNRAYQRRRRRVDGVVARLFEALLSWFQKKQ